MREGMSKTINMLFMAILSGAAIPVCSTGHYRLVVLRFDGVQFPASHGRKDRFRLKVTDLNGEG